MTTQSRRWLPPVLAILVAWGGVELVAGAALHFRLAESYERVIRHDYEGYLHALPQPYLARVASRHLDSLLGWDVGSGDGGGTDTAGEPWSFRVVGGERRNPFPNDRVLIAAYGDSYTFGHEVNDDATWPYFLSELTGTKVLNRGSGAHGLDQTFLKLRRDAAQGEAPAVVVLGVASAALNRLVNCFRPFLRFATGIKLGFKPMLVASEGGLRWLPNPMPELRSRADALAALRIARQHDHWYARRTVGVEFPWSLQLVRLARAVAAGHHMVHRDPWHNPEVTARLRFIVEAFVTHAERLGYRPAIVFIPAPGEARGRREGRPCPGSAVARALAATHRARGLAVADACALDFDETRFNVVPFDGHTSPYGNRVIAEAVYAAVRPWLASAAMRATGRAATRPAPP